MRELELENISRPNVFEIDLRVIAECTRAVRSLIGPDIFFYATLKANAYGYGVLPAAKTVLASGAQAISLASLEDAVMLREAGIRAPILLYAGVPLSRALAAAAAHHDFIVTVHSAESLRCLLQVAPKRMKVAVKVDVGSERIGVAPVEAVALIAEVGRHTSLSLQVVNAHPNLPSHGSVDCLQWQYENFARVCSDLERAGIEVPHRVLASSRVLRMSGASMSMNAVDPGDALFSSLEPDATTGELRTPFQSLKSRLIQVRTATRDVYLNEAPFPVRPGMRIGVLPMGYSDGIAYLNGGAVLVRGRRAPILGKPALEYTRVDLSDIPEACEGDEVVIVGSQGDSSVSTREVMKSQGAARVADLAMQVRTTIRRSYVEVVR